MTASTIRRFALGVSLSTRSPLSGKAPRRASGVLLLGAALWLSTASCGDRSVDPNPPLGPIAELQISASVAGTPVSTLIVTVSAPDIQPELIFNIEAVNGTATGNVALPVGSGRLLVIRAVDASGITTHEGSKQVDVREGTNPTVSIPLLPLVGNQPIDVRIGNRAILITPGIGLITPGGTIALTAAVTDLQGNPVQVPPAEVRWASLNTRVATVDAEGLVTGETLGEVQIVASYGGAAGLARIAVGPAVGQRIFAAGDIAECGPTFLGDERTAALLDGLLDRPTDLVLALGDLAYPSGRRIDYDNCYHPTWGRHKARTRPVPGNHEYRTLNADGYFFYFADVLAPFGATATDPTKGYYSFDVDLGVDVPPWHVIALNSEIKPIANSPQLKWLSDDLASATLRGVKCVLAYWHRPLFNSGEHWGNEPDVKPFWDTLYVKGADVVLVGHEHLYERFAPQTPGALPDPAGGIRQFTVGTGGAELYGFDTIRKPNSEFGHVQDGVLQMVLADNSYSWRFITAPDGVVRDVGVGTCH
jgi:hypothetical protein